MFRFVPTLLLALAVAVCAQNPHLLGNFSIPNPSFLLLDTFGGAGPVNLIVTSFTGNPFVGGAVYNVPDIASQLQSLSSVVPETITTALQWPNTVTYIDEDILGQSGLLLICDGFLIPGKDTGSVSVVPVNGDTPITLTTPKSGYFYHMAVWIDMNADGRLDLLTSRATKPLFGSGSGELLWLEQPATEALANVPWAEHVITAGPDFFFVVDDLDNDPATVEVVSAQFFAPTVGLYVLSASNGSLLQKLVIDDTIGPAEGIMLVDLNGDGRKELLVNNHVGDSSAGVFAFEIPSNIYSGHFTKHILASGFKTVAIGFGSASPGFAYPFYPSTSTTTGHKHIALAGDGAYQAYVLVPGEAPFSYNVTVLDNDQGTVGALAVGDVTGDGYVEIFVPNFDKNYLNVWTYDNFEAL